MRIYAPLYSDLACFEPRSESVVGVHWSRIAHQDCTSVWVVLNSRSLTLRVYLFIKKIMTTYIHIQYHKTEHDYIHTCKNIYIYTYTWVKGLDVG